MGRALENNRRGNSPKTRKASWVWLAAMIAVSLSYPARAQLAPAVYNAINAPGSPAGTSGGLQFQAASYTENGPQANLNFPVTVPVVYGVPPAPPIPPQVAGVPGVLLSPGGNFNGVNYNFNPVNSGATFFPFTQNNYPSSPDTLTLFQNYPVNTSAFVQPANPFGFSIAKANTMLTPLGIQFNGISLADNNPVGNGLASLLEIGDYMDYTNGPVAQNNVPLGVGISAKFTLNQRGAEAAIGVDSVVQVGTGLGLNFVATQTIFFQQIVGGFDGFNGFDNVNPILGPVTMNGAFQADNNGDNNIALFTGTAFPLGAINVPAFGTMREYQTVTLYGDPMGIDNVVADMDVPEPSSLGLLALASLAALRLRPRRRHIA
jgi:hypothetical protein